MTETRRRWPTLRFTVYVQTKEALTDEQQQQVAEAVRGALRAATPHYRSMMMRWREHDGYGHDER